MEPSVPSPRTAGGTYDVIIIGTGAGGGTLAHRLAVTGKKILVIERGSFLPREKQNWDVVQVCRAGRYFTRERWRDGAGRPFCPGTAYWVGGNTKVYGAALFRMRERDFERVQHKGGVSPEWPIRYSHLEPYYSEAERLYGVRGERGVDPTEPPASSDYPFSAIEHEPRIAEIADRLRAIGLNPFHAPMGVQLDSTTSAGSPCIRCNTCDGFPCLLHAKSDAEVICLRPLLGRGNVTLLTEAKALRLDTNASGREVVSVVVEHRNEIVGFRADVVVVACGAINSAALLLRSRTNTHPDGLGNSSGMLGRNLMKHQIGIVRAISATRNATVFQKTLAVHDFYWGTPEFPYPMGHVSLVGKSTKEMLEPEIPRGIPTIASRAIADRTVDWIVTAEDLPAMDNRVRLQGGEVVLEYSENNTAAYDALVSRWMRTFDRVEGKHGALLPPYYLHQRVPLAGVAHQCGTARFGTDPRASVLDVHCRSHDVGNLYVVDSSFFPSSSAVAPSLTVMANALRVGAHLSETLS